MCVTTFFSFDATEVKCGRLEWSPVHRSAQFWGENAARLNEHNYELLRCLVHLLDTSEDALVLSIASFDVGEYGRHYQRGKQEYLGRQLEKEQGSTPTAAKSAAGVFADLFQGDIAEGEGDDSDFQLHLSGESAEENQHQCLPKEGPLQQGHPHILRPSNSVCISLVNYSFSSTLSDNSESNKENLEHDFFNLRETKTRSKKPRPEIWQKNMQKSKRMLGDSYVSRQRKKGCPARLIKQREKKLGPRCISKMCKTSQKRHCYLCTETTRPVIFEDFWALPWEAKQIFG
nr:PREDICTED: uncharacterized protein LOC109040196 [Bemisia tabaci]